ncbi:MAG TPA: ester cyclase [Solirubrobacterales bacterium]|nr:ester cyclase [Solirubrobacterales bacterium]
MGSVVRAYFEALNEGDVERAVSYWKDGARQNVRGQVDTTAPAGVSEQMHTLFAAVPDARFELVSVTEDAGRCAVQWRLTGTFDGDGLLYGVRPTGTAVVLEGADIFDVSAGEIHANNAFSDSLEFVRQIGMMPPRDSPFERLMTGAFNLRTRLRAALRRRR